MKFTRFRFTIDFLKIGNKYIHFYKPLSKYFSIYIFFQTTNSHTSKPEGAQTSRNLNLNLLRKTNTGKKLRKRNLNKL